MQMKNLIYSASAGAIALTLFGQTTKPQKRPNPVVDVESAHQEAQKRYPQLVDKNSPLSQILFNEVERLKRENVRIFDSPSWPLLLAERLDRKMKSAPGLNAGELAELITIPDFLVRTLSIEDALKVLATRSRELDPDRRGVAILLDKDPALEGSFLMQNPPRVTLSLKDTSLLGCIRYLARLGNLTVMPRPDAICLYPLSRNVPEKGKPQIAKRIPLPAEGMRPPPIADQKLDNSGVSAFEDEIAHALLFWGEFRRWDKDPKISIHAQPETVAKFREPLAAGIEQLNSILVGTPVQLELLDGNMSAAEICVYIDRTDNLQRIWRRNGATPVKIDWEGRMEGHWEPTGAFKRVGIYVPIESLSAAPPLVQARYLLAKTTHALGVGNFERGNVLRRMGMPLLQNFFNDPSFAAQSRWKEPKFSAFTDAERRIIRFAYQLGPVSADKLALRGLIKKKWSEVQLPLAQ